MKTTLKGIKKMGKMYYNTYWRRIIESEYNIKECPFEIEEIKKQEMIKKHNFLCDRAIGVIEVLEFMHIIDYETYKYILNKVFEKKIY